MISMINIFNKFKAWRKKRRRTFEESEPVRIVSPLHDVIVQYLKKTQNQSIKNTVILRYVKKDSDVLFKLAEIKSSTIRANDSYYGVDARAIQFIRVEKFNRETKKTEEIKIPVVEVYEGRAEAVSHERWCNDVSLSEEFQKQVYLNLMAGITDAKRTQSATIRQIVVWGLIGIVALVILGGSIFKK